MPASPSFFHGVDSVQVPGSTPPVTTVAASIIGAVGTSRKAPLNTPILVVGNLNAAIAAVGDDRNDGFTLPATIAAIYAMNPSATVVLVNALDGTNEDNQASISDETLTFNTPNTGQLKWGGVIPPDGDIGGLTFGLISAPARTVLSFVSQPASGDTFELHSTTYTFRTALSSGPTVPDEILIGTDLPTTIANALLAISAGSGVGVTYSTGTVANTDVAALAGPLNSIHFKAITAGTAANAYVTTATTSGNHFSFTGATMAGGITEGTKVTAPYKVTGASGTVSLPAGCSLVSAVDASGNPLALANFVLGTRITITYAAPVLVEGTDYTVNYPDGIVTRPSSGSVLLTSPVLVVNYTYIDPTTVTDEMLVGGSVDGSYTGMQCFRDARNEVGVQPRILIAPGHTDTRPDEATANAVAKGLEALAPMLKAIAILDAGNGAATDAYSYAQDYGTSRTYLHYPFYDVLDPAGSGDYIARPASGFIAGLINFVDNNQGWWNSPSNHAMLGIEGIDKSVDYTPGDPNSIAEYLNQNWINTTINMGGFRLWGNRCSDGTFITRQRTLDIVSDSIAQAHQWAVDNGITKGLVEAIVDGVNSYLRFLQNLGSIIDGNAWADPTLNSAAELSDGHLYINFDVGDIVPLEHLTFLYDLNTGYVSEIFTTNTPVVAA